MTLVYTEASVRPTWFGMLPLIVAHLYVDSIESVVFVLTREVDPRGDPVHIAAVLDLHFDLHS